MYLRKPELARDTTLAQIGEVVQLDDAPLATRQCLHAGFDQYTLLAEFEASVSVVIAPGRGVASRGTARTATGWSPFWRGRRSGDVLSRRWRRISPMIVGTA